MSIYLSFDLSIDPSIYRSTDLSIYPSIDLFIYPSIHLSIHLSVHPSIYLSIHLSIYTYMGKACLALPLPFSLAKGTVPKRLMPRLLCLMGLTSGVTVSWMRMGSEGRCSHICVSWMRMGSEGRCSHILALCLNLRGHDVVEQIVSGRQTSYRHDGVARDKS